MFANRSEIGDIPYPRERPKEKHVGEKQISLV